jgi:hypothetical protein
MFAIRANYHTTMQATPMQLVFGHDSILNTKFEAIWHSLDNKNKMSLIETNRHRSSMLL